jgi:hypothetical protein
MSGLCTAQLTCEQEPDDLPLAMGIDPGSTLESIGVVGTKDTALNLMVETPKHGQDAVVVRRLTRPGIPL